MTTIADASLACERLQANTKIPVTCTADYVDEVPSLIVGFRSIEEAQQWLPPFADAIGNPFCAAANRHGREARVHMTVGEGDEQRARRWSCELGKWGKWFPNGGAPEQPSPPETIADAIRACNDVQANRDVPVTCRSDYIDEVVSMIVGFPTAAEANTYMPQVADNVAGPFCKAANRASRRAALYITLSDTRARRYDCEQQRWGDWFELSPTHTAEDRTLERL